METDKKTGFRINPLYILAIVVLVGVVIYVALGYTSGPVVAIGDKINVTYTGTFTNGTVFDSNVGKQPLTFMVGSGSMIKGFDEGVVGMKLNEEKTITIPATEAYGEINPALIVEVPANTFGNQTMEVGSGVVRTVNGQQEQGVVTAISKTNVTLDFNPPLAGQTLIFKIKVTSIQKG